MPPLGFKGLKDSGWPGGSAEAPSQDACGEQAKEGVFGLEGNHRKKHLKDDHVK